TRTRLPHHRSASPMAPPRRALLALAIVLATALALSLAGAAAPARADDLAQYEDQIRLTLSEDEIQTSALLYILSPPFPPARVRRAPPHMRAPEGDDEGPLRGFRVVVMAEAGSLPESVRLGKGEWRGRAAIDAAAKALGLAWTSAGHLVILHPEGWKDPLEG